MMLCRKRVHLNGPTGPLSIGRNQDGVVRIEAARFGDLACGLGWAHAHDRLVQMELTRLVARGEASRTLKASEELVALDMRMRRLGFARDAAEQVGHLSEGVRTWFETYCRGLNEVLTSRSRPLELLLAGHRPRPWAPEDVLLIMKLMSYQGLAQSQEHVEKFIVEALTAGTGLSRMKDLFRPHLDGLDPAWLDGLSVAEPLLGPSAGWAGATVAPRGSNNWALAGSRTASGSTILCNDPHLDVDRLPAVWYEVVLTSGGTYVMGATVPGIPAVMIGRNSRVAWGITYGFMDQIDYFVEDCRDGRFRRGDDWVPFEMREEVLHLKGGGERRFAVHENLHGVLEGDPQEAGRHLCRAWTGHHGVISRTADCLLALLRSTTVREAMDAVAPVTISLNWVFADREGSIGYQQSGALPRRAPGVSGLYPVPGWDAAYDWQGLVDPSELNHLFNPTCGYVATANDDLNPPGGPLAINVCQGDSRARRIRAELASTGRARVEDMFALQHDLVSLQALDLMTVLRPFLPPTAEGRALAAWDGRYSSNSLEASRFEAVYREALRVVFGEGGFGPKLVEALFDDTVVMTDFFPHFDQVLQDPSSAWFEGRPRDGLLAAAVARAFERPVRPWGELRQVTMRNLFFQGSLPRFLGFDYGPLCLVGSRGTPLQGSIYKNLGMTTSCAPSYRFVTELAGDQAHTVLPGGPSGSRFSPFYLSEIELWKSGGSKLLKP